MQRRAFFIATWVAPAALLVLAGCAEKAEETSNARPVAWATVAAYDQSESRRLPGLIRASQRAPLGFEVPGRIAKVNVEIGEKFAKGDVLAQLDTRNFRLNLEERRANLADAQARLVEARKTLGRKLELQKRKVGSQAAVDGARAAKDAAQAQVTRLRALVNLAQEDLDDAKLTAPYNGEVLQRLVEPSQQVRVGETVFEVQGNGSDAEVQVSVPETVVGRLQLGDTATVTFPASPQFETTATVTEIGAGAIARNAFPVTLALQTSSSIIRPGMTAEVRFTLAGKDNKKSDLLAIPVSAFIAGKDQSKAAFVFSDDGKKLQRRSIEIADIHNDVAVVSSGLAAGEIVASKGLPYLKDGQTVERLNVGVKRFQP